MKREEAIEKLQKQKAEYLEKWVDYSGVVEAFDMAIEALSADRSTGEWINTTSGEHYKCSVCGCRASYWFDAENSIEYYNYLDMSEWLSDFCPNCGARMEANE